MDDKELLMNAAKAVGGYVYIEDMGWIEELPDGTRGAWWSPLTDDGDALRLAVKLKLDLRRSPTHGTPGEHLTIRQEIGSDHCAATRRAIVRAAAEIGRGM